MKNHSTASLSSYSGSTSSVVGETPIKSSVIGSHEAMPSLRARLAKNGALQRASSASGQNSMRPPTTAMVTREGGSLSTGTINTPHQNPVKMVQEMVGRVKVLLYNI